jgi:hypothetical protein
MTPCGDLTVLREYTCGCLVYLDELEREYSERGLFCQSQAEHARKLVRGEETQPALF